MRWSVLLVLWLAAVSALAQEGGLQGEFRTEGVRVSGACKGFNFKAVPGCAIALFTDHPLHIVVGSIAPQDGFGFGAAFVTAKDTRNWRLSWDVDAVASTNASWRAGGYMKMVHTPRDGVHVNMPAVSQPGETAETKKPVKKPQIDLVHPYTVFNLYAQTISLNKLNFFGLGDDSTLAGKSVFGMQQTIVGGNVIKPVYEWPAIRKLNLALLGEVNGRFVNLRGNHGEPSPSIEQLYAEDAAPGLSSQPAFVQLGEGFRIKPGLFGDHVQLNYLVSFQQFVAPSNSHYSFLRWTVDLNHSIPLYGHTHPAGAARDTNGPDECAHPVDAEKCPAISTSRNLSGSIGIRLLISESAASASSAVPFYFQPTLGGSDINGSASLSSFQDYRFRAPNILLLRESFEHSIWGPFGFAIMADQGKVALARGDIGFDHLNRTYATGFTLRAGGLPAIFVMYAWGGGEGQHTIFNVNTSLMGGSSRPFLD
jgi:hypothetical protein